MDIREKLVDMSEQLRYCANVSDCANCKRWDNVCGNKCVDSLLLMAADLIDEVANGVTVQEWIPSYDYPKETGFYNCYYKTPDSNLWRVGMCYWNDTNWIQVGFMPVAVQVMFYMPLPKPPKGE